MAIKGPYPAKIPRKSLFKLDEVCLLTGLRPYTLKLWEKEFPGIIPLQMSNGHRLYEHREVETLLQLKKWVFDEKMNFNDARNRLLGIEPEVLEASPVQDVQIVEEIQNEVFPEEHPQISPSTASLMDEEVREKLQRAKDKLHEVVDLTRTILLTGLPLNQIQGRDLQSASV